MASDGKTRADSPKPITHPSDDTKAVPCQSDAAWDNDDKKVAIQSPDSRDFICFIEESGSLWEGNIQLSVTNTVHQLVGLMRSKLEDQMGRGCSNPGYPICIRVFDGQYETIECNQENAIDVFMNEMISGSLLETHPYLFVYL